MPSVLLLPSSVVFIIFCCISNNLALGFLLPRSSPLSCRQSSKVWVRPEEFDDGVGDRSDKNMEGEALAKDFYKQLKQREEQQKQEESDRLPSSSDPKSSSTNPKNKPKPAQETSFPTLPEEEARFLNREPFSKRREVIVGSDGKPIVKKWTGPPAPSEPADGLPTPGGLFSSPPRTSSGQQSPRAQMMERELDLVGQAERGIAIQAVFAIVALCFMIYIGLSGGIVSGDSATNQDFGGDDELPFEQLMPVQVDREASVWL
jgi:hypothetical protein